MAELRQANSAGSDCASAACDRSAPLSCAELGGPRDRRARAHLQHPQLHSKHLPRRACRLLNPLVGEVVVIGDHVEGLAVYLTDAQPHVLLPDSCANITQRGEQRVTVRKRLRHRQHHSFVVRAQQRAPEFATGAEELEPRQNGEGFKHPRRLAQLALRRRALLRRPGP